MGEQKSVKIVVMGNTLQPRQKNNIKHIFDLKGSKVGRLMTGDIKPMTCLKEQNLINICRYTEKVLRFSNHTRK